MPKSKITWIEWDLPFSIGFCPNKVAWDAHMKSAKCDLPYPDDGGAMTHSFREDGYAIITMSESIDLYSITGIGVIVHECIHAWQEAKLSIKEKEPSDELEAYMVQAIVEKVLRAASKRRRK